MERQYQSGVAGAAAANAADANRARWRTAPATAKSFTQMLHQFRILLDGDKGTVAPQLPENVPRDCTYSGTIFDNMAGLIPVRQAD